MWSFTQLGVSTCLVMLIVLASANTKPNLVLHTPPYLRLAEVYTATCGGRFEGEELFSWAVKSDALDIVRVYNKTGDLYDSNGPRNGTQNILSVPKELFEAENVPNSTVTRLHSVLTFVASPRLDRAVLMCFGVNALSLNISEPHSRKAESQRLRILFPTQPATAVVLSPGGLNPGDLFQARCSAYVGTRGVLVWTIQYPDHRERMVVQPEGPTTDVPLGMAFSKFEAKQDETQGLFLSVEMTLIVGHSWQETEIHCASAYVPNDGDASLEVDALTSDAESGETAGDDRVSVLTGVPIKKAKDKNEIGDSDEIEAVPFKGALFASLLIVVAGLGLYHLFGTAMLGQCGRNQDDTKTNKDLDENVSRTPGQMDLSVAPSENSLELQV